jgi:hypothetical protein
MGLGSLDVVALLAHVERERGRPLAEIRLGPATTLGELRGRLAGESPRQREGRLPVRQPAWSSAWPGRALRRLSQPLLIGLWSRFSVRLEVHGRGALAGREGPWLVAAAPHHHWLDGFLVYAGLPRRLRRRLVTVTNRDFSEWFDPPPGIDPRIHREVGWAYYLLWPLVFDFVIIPNFGSTRQGLLELGRYIGGGYSPITFPRALEPPNAATARHEPGMAAVAQETGLPILPIWLQGHHKMQVRPRRPRPAIQIWIGQPLPADPSLSAAEMVARVEAAFGRLAERAREER